MNKLLALTILSFSFFAAACEATPAPSMVLPTPTQTPVLLVAGMDAKAGLDSAQATATQVARMQAQATEVARQAEETRQANYTSTFAAVTADAARVELAKTQAALDMTAQAMTPVALANAQAIATATMQVAQAHSTATQAVIDDRARREAQAESDKKWADFWGFVGTTVTVLVLAVAFVIGAAALVLGASFCVYVVCYANTRMKLEESRTRRESLIRDPYGNQWWYDEEHKVFQKVIEGRPALPRPAQDAPPPDDAIPVNQNGKPSAAVSRNRSNDEAKTALAIALLRDTVAYVGGNPEWEMTKLPGWRQLCSLDPQAKPQRWSGSRWARAVEPLRSVLANDGGDIYLSGQSRYRSWDEILGVLERRRQLA